jgi:hypothetical protein
VVNRVLLGIYRAALHLYPRTFRRAYGGLLAQVVRDRCTFGGRSHAAVVTSELVDVAGSALRMRGEDPMARFLVAVVVLMAAVVAALAAGPVALVPVMLAAIAVYVGMRGAPPVDARSAHPARWLAAAVGAIGAAVAIPLIDGGELNEPSWAAMAVLGVAGVGLALTGLFQLATTAHGSRPSATR